MPAHTGEQARESGTFHCAECNESVSVRKGQKIPRCPNGHTTFNRRTGEPGRK